AEPIEPPASTTLTAANWLAPVNTSSDITTACGTVSPAVVASTPKDMPNTLMARPSTQTARRTGVGSTASCCVGASWATDRDCPRRRCRRHTETGARPHAARPGAPAAGSAPLEPGPGVGHEHLVDLLVGDPPGPQLGQHVVVDVQVVPVGQGRLEVGLDPVDVAGGVVRQ